MPPAKKNTKKRYADHEELKQKYAELVKYFHQMKQQQHKIRKRQFPQQQIKQKKRFIIDDNDDYDDNINYDADVDDENNNNYIENENDDDEFEIIKLKRNNDK